LETSTGLPIPNFENALRQLITSVSEAHNITIPLVKLVTQEHEKKSTRVENIHNLSVEVSP
jgi:hypothetical protein